MAQNNELVRCMTILPIGTQAATITLPGMKIPASMSLRNAWLINQVTLAGDDTNYYTLALKQGATTIATYSTKLTGGQGTVTANVPAPLINTATGLAFTANDQLKLAAADGDLTLVVTKFGTGVPTLASLQLAIHGT
jgi:hypothetical protein